MLLDIVVSWMTLPGWKMLYGSRQSHVNLTESCVTFHQPRNYWWRSIVRSYGLCRQDDGHSWVPYMWETDTWVANVLETKKSYTQQLPTILYGRKQLIKVPCSSHASATRPFINKGCSEFYRPEFVKVIMPCGEFSCRCFFFLMTLPFRMYISNAFCD